MPQKITRRSLAGLAALGFTASEQPLAAQDWLPQQEPDMVKEMVTVAHTDIKRVRELVERRPALANATMDWGFGDWENALGAASHVGRREIAELLLAHGARMSIFAAAMLGHLDVIKAMVAATPGIQKTLGPHSITLLSHAKAGGQPAEAVVKYLEAVGDANTRPAVQPVETADRDAILGTYGFGTGPRDHFIVAASSDRLNIERPGRARNVLNHTGNLVFYPSGAAAVRIAFARENGKVTEMTVADPDIYIRARRQ